MFNFVVGLKCELLIRSFLARTCLGLQFRHSPRSSGDIPVVSDTLVTRFEYSPSSMGPDDEDTGRHR